MQIEKRFLVVSVLSAVTFNVLLSKKRDSEDFGLYMHESRQNCESLAGNFLLIWSDMRSMNVWMAHPLDGSYHSYGIPDVDVRLTYSVGWWWKTGKRTYAIKSSPMADQSSTTNLISRSHLIILSSNQKSIRALPAWSMEENANAAVMETNGGWPFHVKVGIYI